MTRKGREPLRYTIGTDYRGGGRTISDFGGWSCEKPTVSHEPCDKWAAENNGRS